MKLPLHQLAQSSAQGGQVPTWDAASGLWTPQTPAAGGGGGAVILLDYGAAPPADTAVGTVVFWKAPNEIVYDFTAGALPAGWSGHGAPVVTFSAAGAAVQFAAGDGLNRAAPIAGDYAVEAKLVALSSTGTMFGPSITDGVGNGAMCSWYNNPAGVLIESLGSWRYANASANDGGAFAVPCRIRVSKVGNSYTSAYSFDDGATWSAESPALAIGATVSTIGVGSGFASGSATVAQVKVTTGGGNSGKAQGWWDGAQIQPLG